LGSQELERWYDDKKGSYGDLANAIHSELQRILDREGMERGKDYLFIDSRLKTRKSFLEKMYKPDKNGNRKYINPEQITDIAGARIVGYILSNVTILCELIERYFDIDKNLSVTPPQRLGEDQMGYRSSNYIVHVDNRTLKMTKLSQRFNGFYFEVQVKTLLDFAWQEIQHDRVYKTSTQFPPESHIGRKFNLIAGLLEVADERFDTTSEEAKRYDKNLIDKIKSGELEGLEISPRSLRLYLEDFQDVPGFTPYFGVTDQVLDEINSMGITQISQLNQMIPHDFKKKYIKVSKPKDTVTHTAILRDILIIYDTKRYTKDAYRPQHYETLDYHAHKVYKEFQVNFDHLPAGVEFMEGST
jgi:putative GTP pyrophosphokinase